MPSTPQRQTPHRRWRIAWLLGLGVLVNYFDRVNLSVSQAALYTSFGISAVTFGYLSGAYNWTYAMCQLPIGVILDSRAGRGGFFGFLVIVFSVTYRISRPVERTIPSLAIITITRLYTFQLRGLYSACADSGPRIDNIKGTILARN